MKLLPELSFPPSDYWDWDKVKRHWLPFDPFRATEPRGWQVLAEYYRTKYLIAEWVKPKSLCEIGVRAGYSTAAFLQCGTVETYMGIDIDENAEGGIKGYAKYVPAMLDHYPEVKERELLIKDSQDLVSLPGDPFDLVHIDGDHTFAGAVHDIEMVIASGSKWILIDDIDFIPEVAKAANHVIKEWSVKEAYHIADGLRGNILIHNA